MASINITIDVPDGAVPLARRTLGAVLGRPAPATAADIKAALEDYLKLRLKADVIQHKQWEAQQEAANDDTDGASSW